MIRRSLIVPVVLTVLATAFAVFASFSSQTTKPKQFIGIFKVVRADFLKNGPKPEEMPIIIAHRDYWQKIH